MQDRVRQTYLRAVFEDRDAAKNVRARHVQRSLSRPPDTWDAVCVVPADEQCAAEGAEGLVARMCSFPSSLSPLHFHVGLQKEEEPTDRPSRRPRLTDEV